jgi:ABC-2 type transport system permease protein
MRRNRLWKIIRMEFRLTAMNKAFLIFTILGPFFISAVTILPSLLAPRGALGGNTELKVAIVNADPRFFEGVRAPLAQNRISVLEVHGNASFLDSEVLAGRFDGYLILPDELTAATRLQYVSRNVSDLRTIGVLQGVLGQAIVSLRLIKAGVLPEKIVSLTQPPVVETRQVAASGRKEDRDYLKLLMTGLTLGMLLYMTVLLYGQTIGRSVLSEKTSKTVEIMLSSVSPVELMFGKIFGKAAASILQYGVWVAATSLFVTVLGPRFGVSVSIGGGPGTFAFLVLFFLLAFFLYCSLFAALGAASQDEQNLSQLAWPLIMFLVLPIVMISTIIMSPSAPVIVVLSLFPLTAPMVMFLRVLAGAASPWEILASIGILLASIAAAIALSAKIFRVGLLMTGRRFRLVEVLRWIRS